MHRALLLRLAALCAFVALAGAFWSDSITWSSCASGCTTTCDSGLPSDWSQHTSSGDNRHWQRQTSAPTSHTGAKFEHSGVTNSRFLHLETGRTNDCDEAAIAGDLFQITTPEIDLSPYQNAASLGEGVYFTFWLWMYGTSVAWLNVSVSENSNAFENALELAYSSRINNWQVKTIDLEPYLGSTIRIRFNGQAMPSIPLPLGNVVFVYGDISIDDLELYYTGDTVLPVGSEANATWLGLSRRYPTTLAFAPFLRDQTGVFVASDRTIRLWGGLDANNALADKVHVYSVDERTFLTTTFLDDDADEDADSAQRLHNAPLPRRLTASVALSDQLFIYGGSDYRGPVTDQEVVVSYSFATGNFSVLQCTTSDPAEDPNHFNFVAEGASAVVDDVGNVWLYGGRTTTVQLNFVSQVVMPDCQFQKVSLQLGAPIPRSRWGHISTFTNNGNGRLLWIFGGRFQPSDSYDPVLLSDVQLFDIDNSRWRDLIVHDPKKAPTPRAFPAGAQNAAGDKWIIYGGYDDSDPNNPIVYNDVYMLVFDIKYAYWRELSVAGDSIPRRAGHVMVPTFIPAENQEAFLIFGGYDGNLATANSVEKLDFGSIDSEVPPPKTNDDDDGDDDSVIIIAVVLSVVFGLCLLLLLALLIGTIVSLLLWKAHKKKALQRKYGIGNAPATEMEALNE